MNPCLAWLKTRTAEEQQRACLLWLWLPGDSSVGASCSKAMASHRRRCSRETALLEKSQLAKWSRRNKLRFRLGLRLQLSSPQKCKHRTHVQLSRSVVFKRALCQRPLRSGCNQTQFLSSRCTFGHARLTGTDRQDHLLFRLRPLCVRFRQTDEKVAAVLQDRTCLETCSHKTLLTHTCLL